MGSRRGGTALRFAVRVGPNAAGQAIVLSALHIDGSVDVSPRDVQQVRLRDVSITASRGVPGLLIDEIGMAVPSADKVGERVLIDDCWVRGGTVGIVINAVGCALRRCRVQGASTFGIHANAHFSVDSCTIGGWGGGILARRGVTELRLASGVNANRVQEDQHDTGFNGYRRDCGGCIGRCTCTALVLDMERASGRASSRIIWSKPGQGAWQNVGCA